MDKERLAGIELAYKETGSPERWYVSYDEQTDDNGNGQCGLAVGPNEEDMADALAFSLNFSARAGSPDEIDAAFELMAAAPEMFREMVSLRALVERLVVANHMRQHATLHGPTFDKCEQGFCAEWRELMKT